MHLSVFRQKCDNYYKYYNIYNYRTIWLSLQCITFQYIVSIDLCLLNIWIDTLLDINESAEDDATVHNGEEGEVSNVECNKVFTVKFDFISGWDLENVTVANIIEILDINCSKRDLEAVGHNEHHIDGADCPPEKSQGLQDDVPRQR